MIRGAAVALAGLVLLGNPATARRASADPLLIQSGFVFVSQNPAGSFGLDFGFLGTDFAFVGEAPPSPEYFAGFSPSQPPFLLRFADVLDPSSNSSCPGCSYTGDFLFTFPATAASQIVPFSVTGTLSGFLSGSTDPVVRHQLVGSGDLSAGPDSALFRFTDAPVAPVPEPTALLLIGTGLAGLVARSRKASVTASSRPPDA